MWRYLCPFYWKGGNVIVVNNNLRLWYKESARDWNEALPIGNGRLGGMIFGNTEKERIQLNEDSIWYGGPVDRNNPDAFTYLPKIRSLLFEGKIKEAERLATMALSGTPEGQRHYQPLGDLFLNFNHDKNRVENYLRELDLNSGLVKVQYSHDGVTYTREHFASAVDQVIVIRITADKPSSISFDAQLRRGKYIEKIQKIAYDSIMLRGNTGGEEGISFSTIVRAIARGGKVCTIGENLLVEDADEVVLLLSAATTFRNEDYIDVCEGYIDNAAGRSYEDLLQDHVKDYQALFNRMELNLQGLNDRAEELENLPTDERLKRVREGKDDFGLISLYFQFGRYLLISCSRPGTLPANLQGIWNQHMLPPWDSKYTININAEMNYWPAEVCNLSECHEPLFDLLERMREPGRRTARAMYGCRGFVAHHNTDIYGDTAPQDIYIPATYWPMGAAWLSLHLWEHYEFTQDIEFLREKYPVMREAAEFFLDFLVEDSKGRLVTCPSVSPENSYRLENGEQGALCVGPSMDSQIIYALYSRCIEAAQILGVDEDYIQSFKEVIDKLPKPEIGKYGQIQEWAEDYEEVEPGHRHISHLFALHPGNQITVRNTPELAQAARKTLERRLAHGGGHTGWSRAWIINMWARLEDGEEAYNNLKALIGKSTLPNMFDTHPPFQIDGNFGGIAGIAEMLIQSHAGEISLLPALPEAWVGGSIKGVRARGGLEVDMEWRQGRLDKVVLKPQVSGTFMIRYKQKSGQVKLEAGVNVVLDGNLKPVN
ncbi:MAG: glycoside hydrolase family 95 protein [Clostridiales bacterium]|nr:glycoside hydrolase family 95 protein [Clostridiales bacterium]